MQPVSLPALLVAVGDLPVSHTTGALQHVESPVVLQNAGGALSSAVQSIVLQTNPHHLSGTVWFYWYASSSNAITYYQRRTEQVDGQPLADLGEQALIQTTPSTSQGSEQPTTALYFRRGRAVVLIIGYGHPDLAFAGVLSLEGVIRYALRLDQRLAYAHHHPNN